MPIRINLLAESQAAEELRRKDPVKRAIWIGICVVVVVLVWSSSLQVKIMAENGNLNRLEGQLNSKTNEYNKVLANQKKLLEVNAKLASLNQLAASRFLQGTVLDAFQHSPVDGIQIGHLRTEQFYEVVPEVAPTKTDTGRVIPGKPGSSVEKVKLFIDARDGSTSPGIVQVNKFRDILCHTPYFESEKIGTNNITLKSITPPNIDNDSQKPFVLFALECMYHDRPH